MFLPAAGNPCIVADLHACCWLSPRRFTLIASNIPLTSTSDPLQSLPESLSAQSTMQQLLASTGAAQAASLSTTDQAAPGVDALLSNPILQLDDSIHQYVASHTTEAFRLWADVWISDAFITAGVLGWAACTAACLVKAPAKSAGPLATAWGFYFATCGALKHFDPLLVDALKHFFARARPSTLHHTFSFPSGHTSAAVFVVGALLTVLLPLTLQLWASSGTPSSSTPSNTAQRSSGVQYSSGDPSSTQGSAVAGILVADAAVLAVWGAAWATTATGRILSESHWLSDTLAGGFLAIASVSGLALTTRLVQEWQGSARDTAATASSTSAQGDS